MKHLHRLILVVLALIILALPGAGHGGEKHEDIREGGAPTAAPAATPATPPREEQREVQAGARRYEVTFRLPPAPRPGHEIQAEVRVVELLSPPDPLLGARAPVEGAKVTGRLDGPSPADLGEAHAEQESGSYGLHFTPSLPGRYRLDVQVTPSGVPPFPATTEFEVTREPTRQAAWYGAWGALALALAMTAFMVFRGRARMASVAVPLILVWGLLGGGAGALLYWAQRPATPAPAPPSRPTAAEETPGVAVPADMQRLLGMTVETVRPRTVVAAIRVPGRVVAPQGAVHLVHAPRTGRVLSESFPRVGQRVAQGQVLAELQESLPASERIGIRAQEAEQQARRLELERTRLELRAQLGQLEGQRRSLASQLEQRRLELVRAQRLYEIRVAARKDVDAARFAVEQAQAQVRGMDAEIVQMRRALNLPMDLPQLPPVAEVQRFSVTAPIDGLVAAVDVAPGEIVAPDKALFRVVDLSTVWVRAQVPERELAVARRSGSARVTTVPYPGPFSARLLFVESLVNPETRTVDVVYQMGNPGLRLLENMAAEVEILGASRQAITVPAAALVVVENESRVFVRVAPDRFEARSVKTGPTHGTRVEILSGLEGGAPVVTRGAGQLASELARRGSASAPEGEQH